MVNPFTFCRLPLIVYGCGKTEKLPGLIKRYGPRVLLLTGNFAFKDSPAGIRFSENGRSEGISPDKIIITGEPSVIMIDQVAAQYRKRPPDVVVSVGGGSTIDAGKAISAMIPVQGNIRDFLEGVGNKDHPGVKIPLIAVPTTSGTGSEATKNAVISRVGKNGFKKSLRHDNIVPDIALVDPVLTLTCPPDMTAASGMDCFSQLAEAYLSVKSNEYTDALAIEGLKAVKSSLTAAFRDGSDLLARSDMSFAALTSGICLANAGLGVVHGFASSIGGLYEIPHGLICGTLMAVSNEITVKRLRERNDTQKTLKKYATLGGLFLDDAIGRNDDQLIDEFIEYLHNLTAELNLSGLKTAGISENDLEEIAVATECKNNPVKLETSDLLEILNRRFL